MSHGVFHQGVFYKDAHIGKDGRLRLPVRSKAARLERVKRIKANIAATPSIPYCYPEERRE